MRMIQTRHLEENVDQLHSLNSCSRLLTQVLLVKCCPNCRLGSVPTGGGNSRRPRCRSLMLRSWHKTNRNESQGRGNERRRGRPSPCLPEIHLNNCLWSVPQIKSALCDCNRRISATAACHWHAHEVRVAVAMRLKHTLRDLALPPSVSRSC